MNRYAAHYVLWPGTAFFKQCAVAVENGRVRHVFGVSQELESIEWHPGVIVLMAGKEDGLLGAGDMWHVPEAVLTPELAEKASVSFSQKRVQAWLFYPFNFTSMRPVGGTRRRQLL